LGLKKQNLIKIKMKNDVCRSRVFLLLLLIFVINSCISEKNEKPGSTSPRIRKNIELVSPKINQSIQQGEIFLIKAAHKKSIKIDSIQVFQNQNNQTYFSDSVVINTKSFRLGTQNIRCIVYAGGESEVLYPKVILLASEAPVKYTFRVVNSYPHDDEAYTQGLFIYNDFFIESTGQRGMSTIRRVELKTGKVLENFNLESSYFGEGATVWTDKIYQLTWTSQVAFVYDLNLKLVTTFNYSTEGWGLTTMGDTLVMSDGSEKLYFMNPLDFSEMDILQVYDHQGKVDNLNELEYFQEMIYANIYGKDKIVLIDPKTGAVKGEVDFTGIIDRSKYRGMDYAMNGIAFDVASSKIYVTGKWWPTVHEVEIFPPKILN